MTTARIVIRPARPEDKPAAMAVSAQVWGGEDYVPYVWDRWLADPEGRLSVATLRGKLAGFAKLTLRGPGEWWLEGMRVDPHYRGRGIARLLHDAHIALAAAHGPGTIRLSTGGDNLVMHHIAGTSGFRKIGQYAHLLAPALTRAEAASARASGTLLALDTFRQADLPALERFVRRSLSSDPRRGRLRAASGVIATGWSVVELTPARLAEYVRARQALGWRAAGGAVAALALVHVREHDGRPMLQIDCAEGRVRGAPGLTELHLALRDFARRRHVGQLAAATLAGSAWERALLRAGFAYEWSAKEDDQMWVFERPLP
jgi:GNAT superfamily N-acetyltransferase